MKSHDVRDALVKPAIDEQKAAGKEPKVKATVDYIVSVLQNLDRKQSEQKPKASKQTTKRKGATQKEFNARLNRARREAFGDIREWFVERDPEDQVERSAIRPARRQQDKTAKIASFLMRKRLSLLASKPDWNKLCQPCVSVLSVATPGTEIHNMAARRLMDIVAKSNDTFGDWTKVPGKKLYFG